MAALELSQPLTYNDIKKAVIYWSDNTSSWRNCLDLGRVKNGFCPEFIGQLKTFYQHKPLGDVLGENEKIELAKIINNRELRHDSNSRKGDITDEIVKQLKAALDYEQPQLLTEKQVDECKKSVPEYLGVGQYSSVFKESYNNQDVAKKVLKPQAKIKESYQRELYNPAFRAPPHRNIIKLLAYSPLDQESCFMFEMVDNGNLSEKLNSKQLSSVSKVHIAQQIGEAVLYLQNYRISHLDLKPVNIALTKDLTPKILDFGFSFCFSTDEMYASEMKGLVGMTIAFASPEAMYIRSASPRPKITMKYSDVYSYAITLWCLANDNNKPCANEHVKQKDFLSNLIKGDRPKTPENIKDPLIKAINEMAKACWEELPQKRKPLGQVINFFKQKIEGQEQKKPEDEAVEQCPLQL